MDERVTFTGKVENANSINKDNANNAEFEITVNGILILKGHNLDELISLAKLMYPDKPIGIKKIKK